MTRGMIAKVQHLVRVVDEQVRRSGHEAQRDRRPSPARRKKRIRIGRGIGSGTGKTGGRGGKGQTARSGVRIKGFEGGQMPLHRRLPKRGFKNTKFALQAQRGQSRPGAGGDRRRQLDAGAVVDAAALVKAGLLRRAKDGVRLLGTASSRPRSHFAVWGASKSAVAAVEKAGGSVKILAPKRGGGRKGRLMPYGNRPVDPHMDGRLAGRRNGSFSAWSRQRNNWRPISTSRRSPRPRS